MRIKNIRKQGSKYKIILENNDVISTYDEVILNNNILYKKDINSNLLNSILEQNKYYDEYNKVLKYVKAKLRSEFDVLRYIDKLDLSFDDKDKIINNLRKNRLIDDLIYTRAYIHDRMMFSSDGPYKIKNDLIKEKIDISVIESELENIDKCELINKLEKLVVKRIQANTKYTYSVLKTKLLNYFINLGYDKSDVLYMIEKNKCFSKVLNNALLNKTYKSLYNKYKDKYDEYELKRVIGQKLYQKGFSIDEINSIN